MGNSIMRKSPTRRQALQLCLGGLGLWGLSKLFGCKKVSRKRPLPNPSVELSAKIVGIKDNVIHLRIVKIDHGLEYLRMDEYRHLGPGKPFLIRYPERSIAFIQRKYPESVNGKRNIRFYLKITRKGDFILEGIYFNDIWHAEGQGIVSLELTPQVDLDKQI